MLDIVIRAVVVGTLISLCSALLGVPLVLKRYSMIGDGLSHVAFGCAAIALATRLSPLAFSLPCVIVAAFILLKVGKRSDVGGDAAIAIAAGSALALGIVVTKLSGGANIDINSYMFGSIWGVEKTDLWFCIPLCAVVIILFVVFYNIIFAITFDETFSKAKGINVELYNVILAVLTSVTVVIGMRLVGTLLISSLIIFPFLSSRKLFSSFRGVVISSGIISVVCFCAGIVATYFLDIPTGAGIVLINAAVFIIFLLLSKIRCLKK